MEHIRDSFQARQNPIGNSDKALVKRELPIAAVDKLAEELVVEYSNPDFKSWYCGIIYDFGFSQVLEWRKRASEGDEPGKLFSKYVRDARTFKQRGSQNETP